MPEGKKALAKGRRPPQELEIGPRSGPYLLVYFERLISFGNNSNNSNNIKETTLLKFIPYSSLFNLFVRKEEVTV